MVQLQTQLFSVKKLLATEGRKLTRKTNLLDKEKEKNRKLQEQLKELEDANREQRELKLRFGKSIRGAFCPPHLFS